MRLFENVSLDTYRDLVAIYDGTATDERNTNDPMRRLPVKWNVVILNLHIDSELKNGYENGNDYDYGIFITLHTIKECFHDQSPLRVQICEDNYYTDGERGIYIIYSKYIPEIKTILPILGSLEGHFFKKCLVTPKMNIFFHYMNVDKNLMMEFKNVIENMIKVQKMDCFLTVAKMNQDILEKNLAKISDNCYQKTIMQPFWNILCKTIHKTRNPYYAFYNLSFGGDLTYKIIYSLSKKYEIDKTLRYNQDQDRDTASAFMDDAIDSFLHEYQKKRQYDKYRSVNYFILAFYTAMKCSYHANLLKKMKF
jgi:hypothetical protein